MRNRVVILIEAKDNLSHSKFTSFLADLSKLLKGKQVDL